jgi:hypothetical protein
VDIVDALHRCGGLGDHATLLRLSSRRKLSRAVAAGEVVRVSRGRYALPTAEAGLVAAHRLSGVLSHRSAATWWGWELEEQPRAWRGVRASEQRLRSIGSDTCSL